MSDSEKQASASGLLQTIGANEDGVGTADLSDSPRDGTARLRALGAEIQEQDDLERSINRQADQLLTEQANERDSKRLEKAKSDKHRLESQIRRINTKLNQPILPPAATVSRLQNELDHYQTEIELLNSDIREIESRIQERNGDLDEHDVGHDKEGRLPGESRRDFLIRTGKITPFSRLAQPTARVTSDLRETLLDAEQDRPDEDEEVSNDIAQRDERSHVHLKRPGFEHNGTPAKFREDSHGSKTGKRRVTATNVSIRKRQKVESDTEASATSDFQPDESTERKDQSTDLNTSDEDDFQPEVLVKKKKRSKQKSKRLSSRTGSDDSDGGDNLQDLAGVDDGNEALYNKRLTRWIRARSVARSKTLAEQENADELPTDEEWYLPHPSCPDLDLGDGYRLPGDVHPALFDYQRTGVQWLSELYKQGVGGIVGDEMGLGKTIQIISFLAGLHYSRKITKPIIVVCPATVMKQWVNEFHTWWPAFRVSILHSSGSGMIDMGRETRDEEALLDRAYSAGAERYQYTKTERAAQKIVDRVVKEGHILVTTYAGLQSYAEFLIPVDWEYAVLDEGHKIRNPNASITIHCKELRTANRIILSGTPIQNNLVELWSLFDFIYPMRLGTLVNFRSEFEDPIRRGGYANASNLQVMTAQKCAETLKDSIQPYLLQRLKVDVAADLPKKTEQVLFCKLTEAQRLTYTRFLKSDEMKSISEGKRQMLFGIDILRKICNHPDLVEHKILSKRASYNYGDPKASGKMLVVRELLDMWSKGGHKTLLFCQNRIMLDILQKFVEGVPGIKYRRMDGNTPIKERQVLVDEFNEDPELHVFLLTTKVGGLGVNLTGADRVIIFDPDWNPSTDMQARERAWRLGQKREVQIFRLMMAGTIEEKIFHRQIFKQFLTNKILKDPKQRQTFQMKDLHDLFTLGDEYKDGTETGKMFKGTETHVSALKPSEDRNTVVSKSSPKVKDEVDPFDPAYTASKLPQALNAPNENVTGPSESLLSVQGVSSIEEGDVSKPAGEEAAEQGSEQRLLTGIFARSGVASTVEHDRIVNGKIEYAADSRILQRQAEKVAAEAARSLREAEKLAKATPVGVPTWTGEAGSAGRPPSPPASRRDIIGRGGGGGIGGRNMIGGAVSANILSGLRDRQSGSLATSGVSSPASSTSSRAAGQTRVARRTLASSRRQRDTDSQTPGPTAQDFGSMIREFLLAHGGTVFTQMLLDQFGHTCHTERQSAEFKAMLREIATLSKGRGGRGRWTIKPEYRT